MPRGNSPPVLSFGLAEAQDASQSVSEPALTSSPAEGAGAVGGSPEIGPSAEAGASVATGKGPATRPGRRASTFHARGGRRIVNAYPLTELELYTLGVIQGASALFFGIAGGALGFWLSVKQSISFAGVDTPTSVIAYWQGIETAALIAALLFGLLGLLAFVFSGWKVNRIRKETEHG